LDPERIQLLHASELCTGTGPKTEELGEENKKIFSWMNSSNISSNVNKQYSPRLPLKVQKKETPSFREIICTSVVHATVMHSA